MRPHAFLTIAIALLGSSGAQAASHLWRFNEFYSSPDRKVQFIEMQEVGGSAFEHNISEHWYTTNSYNLDQSELLGTDLVGNTANKKFLVGTPSYAALPGVPAPDYIIPDGAIDPSGDTVVWWFYQTIEIPPGVMPSDGTHSITVLDPDPLAPRYTLGINSPTNFAGDTGTVVLPAGLPSMGAGALVSLCLALLAIASWRSRARPHSASRSAAG